MKIVINGRFGGFGLSQAGHYELGRRLRLAEDSFCDWDIKRTNSDLVEMIEENASLYSGDHARLHVVEVPDDVQWHIHDYDGSEHVAENHRIWQ